MRCAILYDVRNRTAAGHIRPFFCLRRWKGQKVRGNGSCCQGKMPAAVAASERRREVGREREGFYKPISQRKDLRSHLKYLYFSPFMRLHSSPACNCCVPSSLGLQDLPKSPQRNGWQLPGLGFEPQTLESVVRRLIHSATRHLLTGRIYPQPHVYIVYHGLPTE